MAARISFAPFIVVVGVAGGCVDDTATLLADGRIMDACLRSQKRPDERAQMTAWLVEQAPVTVRGLAASEVEAALGAAVWGYGPALGVYDVSVTLPGVALDDDDPDVVTQVAIQESLGSGLPLSTLVERLPPLALPARAPRVPAIDPRSLVPTPKPRGGGRATDPIGAFIEAAVEVGGAIGMVVAAPFIALGAAVGGFFSALGSIFGGGSGGGDTRAAFPIEEVAVTDAAVADALFDETDAASAQATLQREHDALVEAVHRERDRRVALLGPALLDPGSCKQGACRVLGDDRPWPERRSVDVWLTRETFWGTARCALHYDAPVVVERVAAAAPRSDDDNTALQNAWRQKAALAARGTAAMTPLPSYALEHSAALPKANTLTRAQTKPRTVDGAIADLHCRVNASDGNLTARVVVGGARSRVTTLDLGSARDVTFIVHGANLEPGERLRVSLASRGRSLGADVVTFDARAPLSLQSAAFRATCVPLDEALDATLALAAADRAIDAFDNTEADARAWSKRRQQAEAAVVAAAALVGYDDPAVAERVQRLSRR